jgi:hypothetical protein
MATTKVQLSGGAFQDVAGNPLANGFLLMRLSQDGQVNTSTEVCAGWVFKVLLDASGNVSSSPPQSVWPNDVISPSGTFYNVSAYSAEGQLVWGPNAQQVLSTPSPYNIGAWIPGSVNVQSGGGGGSGAYVALNPTGSQTVTQPAGTSLLIDGADQTANLTSLVPVIIHAALQQDSGDVTFAQKVSVAGMFHVSSSSTFDAPVTINSSLYLANGTVGTNSPIASLGSGNYGFGTYGDVNAADAVNSAGGLGAGQRTVTANTSVLSSDYSVWGNAAAGVLTITLPDATSFNSVQMPTLIASTGITDSPYKVGRMFVIKKMDSSANAVTVAAASGQTIDGQPSITLSSQYNFVVVQTDGSNWGIIGH